MTTQGKSWFHLRSIGEVDATKPAASPEPTWLEVFLTVGVVLALHLLLVWRLADFWQVVLNWGDNPGYLGLAAIIRNWHHSGGDFPAFFWGFPYAIVGASTLFSISPLMALVIVSMLSSLAMSIIVCRLYGGWVAVALYSFINYHMIFMAVEGGSELPFMCLLFASFLAARSERWNLAALLAALSTTVRPVGIFALVAFAVILARRRSYRRLTEITLIGLTVGVVYVIPTRILLGNPFASVIHYRDWWGPQRLPVTYPFGVMIPSFLAFQSSRWPNIVLTLFWLAAALAATVAMWLPRNRGGFSLDQPEIWFTSIYTLFIISYTDTVVCREFARYVMPIVPLIFYSFRHWIPRDRRLLWPAAFLSVLLASAAQVGFMNVFGFRCP